MTVRVYYMTQINLQYSLNSKEHPDSKLSLHVYRDSKAEILTIRTRSGQVTEDRASHLPNHEGEKLKKEMTVL